MQAGEYAVHYSSFPAGDPGTPYCDIFPSLTDAETHAREEVLRRTDVRCRVYDAQGLVGAPLFEVAGKDYKGESNLSHFRRWVGGVTFILGLVLTLVDVFADYRLLWPSAIGTRLLIPGAVLLVTEGLVVLTEHHNAKKALARQEAA